MIEKLVPDPFLKNQNWVNLWLKSLKCHKDCYYCMSLTLIWVYVYVFGSKFSPRPPVSFPLIAKKR